MQSVYIAFNIDYPGLVKIGWYSKSHPAGRIKDLYSAGVLNPWILYYFAEIENGRYCESKIFKRLDYCRAKEKKEFFITTPENAKKIIIEVVEEISKVEKIYSLTQEKKLLKRKRAENIDLYSLGLNFGDILYFSKNLNIQCSIFSNKTVLFNEKELTLTEAARYTGLIPFKEIQGPRYWTFDGKSLVDIRKETELLA